MGWSPWCRALIAAEVVDGVNGLLQRIAMSTPLVWRMAVPSSCTPTVTASWGGAACTSSRPSAASAPTRRANDSPVAPSEGIYRSQISGIAAHSVPAAPEHQEPGLTNRAHPPFAASTGCRPRRLPPFGQSSRCHQQATDEPEHRDHLGAARAPGGPFVIGEWSGCYWPHPSWSARSPWWRRESVMLEWAGALRLVTPGRVDRGILPWPGDSLPMRGSPSW
jgi:hypothetical protein